MDNTVTVTLELPLNLALKLQTLARGQQVSEEAYLIGLLMHADSPTDPPEPPKDPYLAHIAQVATATPIEECGSVYISNSIEHICRWPKGHNHRHEADNIVWGPYRVTAQPGRATS